MNKELNKIVNRMTRKNNSFKGLWDAFWQARTFASSLTGKFKVRTANAADGEILLTCNGIPVYEFGFEGFAGIRSNAHACAMARFLTAACGKSANCPPAILAKGADYVNTYRKQRGDNRVYNARLLEDDIFRAIEAGKLLDKDMKKLQKAAERVAKTQEGVKACEAETGKMWLAMETNKLREDAQKPGVASLADCEALAS